jgi:NAD(P)-dependent dehydrogenase (short-subunit alcohol dehydrogenase family)
VTREGDPEKTAEAVAQAFGCIDVAFANAGYGVSGPFEELTEADFRQQFETNVYGVLRTARAALPHLLKSKGSLAITGSVLGHLSLPGGTPYAMSKFAVRALAEALRGEWSRRGVAVTLISPGFVASEIRIKDGLKGGEDPVPGWLVVPAANAAREIVRAIEGRVAERVVTGHGKWVVLLNRLLPNLLPRVLPHLLSG